VGNPVAPKIIVRGQGESMEVRHHRGAVLRFMADCAIGIEQGLALFIFTVFFMADGAIISEHGLAIGARNCHLANTIGIRNWF
jgi:hypothetical protein